MKKIQHNFLRNRCRWYNFKQFDKADPNSSHIYYQQWNASIHTQIWMTAHFIVLHKRWQNENEKFRLQTDMRCQWNLICSNICILDPIKLSRKADLCDSKFNLAHFFFGWLQNWILVFYTTNENCWIYGKVCGNINRFRSRYSEFAPILLLWQYRRALFMLLMLFSLLMHNWMNVLRFIWFSDLMHLACIAICNYWT